MHAYTQTFFLKRDVFEKPILFHLLENPPIILILLYITYLTQKHDQSL